MLYCRQRCLSRRARLVEMDEKAQESGVVETYLRYTAWVNFMVL